MNAPLVAVVLPPREGFGPGRTGAVGLITQRLAEVPGFETLVIGGEQAGAGFAGIDFAAVRPPFWRPGNINTRYAAGIAALLGQRPPALIEVHNRTEVALSLARRFPRIPVTLFLHNDPQGMRAARSPAQRTRLLHRLHRVVCVSAYLRSRLIEGVSDIPRPPAVLANAIDLSMLPEPAARTPEILFVGRVVPDKGADAFVAACAAALPRLPGWSASIIGADRFRADSPETDYTRKVQTAAQQTGIALPGYCDHPAVLKALSRAAIAVVPSRWAEPFGLVALEAMACGAALVCSPRGGLREVAGDAALYADPDDIVGMTQAIVSLAQDEARREALAGAGRRRARLFDVAHAIARLAALRHEALGAGG